MPRKIKTIDANKATKSELIRFASNNARYVNSLLDSLEKNDMQYAKAYQYTQNKLRNKSFMKRGKTGDLRFFSTKKDFSRLSYNELRGLVQTLQGYKATRSGSVAGQKAIEKDIYDSFLSTAKKRKIDTSKITEEDFKAIVESVTFQNAKEASQFSSSEIFRYFGKYGVNEITENILEEAKNDTIMELYRKAEEALKQTSNNED